VAIPRAGHYAIAIALVACGTDRAPAVPIRFLHTFSADETVLLNKIFADHQLAVDASQVPFARGQQVIGEMLRAGAHCPDLIRIDATWLPELAGAHLLAEAPAALVALDWTPEAAELAHQGAHWLAVPQTVDGLFVARAADTPAPAAASIDALREAAEQVAAKPHPLGLRLDGYWSIPWLRADGIELGTSPAPAAGIDQPGAVHAIVAFTQLFGTLAPPPPPAGSEAPDELRRWRAGELAYWVTGPWQLGALSAAERAPLAITPLAHAPRGGQLLVVPACAPHPADGWRLAEQLSSVEVEAAFAAAGASVPARASALAQSPQLVRDEYAALVTAEPLPRATWTPLLFDDLDPALAAVAAGDASADEVVAGVRRAWHRIGAVASSGSGSGSGSEPVP
jgi:hypothetical protein